VVAHTRNKRREPGGDPNRGEARSGPRAALRLRDGKDGAAAQPQRGASEGRSAASAIERSSDSAWALVFGCWVIASASTLGALFFSEVMELPPCVLCWYQRIFMFPLVLLLPLGLFPFDKKVIHYALPLALSGWLISLFHLLLVSGFIPESMTPCTQGVPCKEVQIQWLGFVSIPLLSFVAFSMISALMIAARLRIPK
jgi:disulfide bond formation protein DsbB